MHMHTQYMHIHTYAHNLARTHIETDRSTHTTHTSAGVRVTVMDAIPEWP